ncbi:MAG: hypothetical protein ACTS4T_01385 [Candidatus Hodgkinia cicadicola]
MNLRSQWNTFSRSKHVPPNPLLRTFRKFTNSPLGAKPSAEGLETRRS